MKRLLLAPLLFLLVSCSSDLTVNRRTVNRRPVNRRTETYIELCNNSELPGNSRDYVYCYKVKGKNREKITAKGFIEAAKELSRERLDACLRPNQFAQSLRPYEQERGCRAFINEPHSYWLMNEITKEQYDLVKKYISEYDLKRIERMERLKYTNIDKELKKYNTNSGSKLDLFFYCQEQQKNIGATREEMNKACGRIPL
tara:strand:+ start:24 stop:623 length:600 start_codon:yes stop_codon:yes gene_type:complete